MNIKGIIKKKNEVLLGKKFLLFLVMVMYIVMTAIPNIVATTLTSFFNAIKYGGDIPLYAQYISPFSAIALLIYVVEALLVVGFIRMKFDIVKENSLNIGTMFSGVKYWGKALGIIVLTGLYTFLWMLLFIVPGIVKGISYSMALYIYAKNPEKGVRQCIAESVELMNGKKMKFFLLRLRYIGWTLLIWIPSIPLIIATVLASLNAVIIAILIFIISLPVMLVLTIVVLVHEEMAYTIFYFDITNDLKTDAEMSNINFSKDNVEKYEYTDIL